MNETESMYQKLVGQADAKAEDELVEKLKHYQ